VAEQHFPQAVWDLLEPRVAVSQEAQDKGDDILQRASAQLQHHFGYRVYALPRLFKTRDALDVKAHRIQRENPQYSPKQVVEEIRDLAAGRITVLGIRDIRYAHRLFCGDISSFGNCALQGPEADNVDNPREGGFRGLTQHISVMLGDGQSFPFEIQFMSYFQNAWDQAQHPLYELRRRGSYPDQVAQLDGEFEALSLSLHQLDLTIDGLRLRLGGLLSSG